MPLCKVTYISFHLRGEGGKGGSHMEVNYGYDSHRPENLNLHLEAHIPEIIHP